MKDKTFMGEVAALRDRNLAYDQQIDQTADIAIRHLKEYTDKLTAVFNGCEDGELPVALMAFEKVTDTIREIVEEKPNAIMAGYILCKSLIFYDAKKTTVCVPSEEKIIQMMGRDGK